MSEEGKRLVLLLHPGEEERRGPDCYDRKVGSRNRKPGGGDGGGPKVLCLIVLQEGRGGGAIAEFYDGGRDESDEGGF